MLAAALASGCDHGLHYGLVNAPGVTRDWQAEDRARDAVANGPEACEPSRRARVDRDRRDRDRAAQPVCADRGLLGIPARGGPVPR
jgi:hypothetical protein